MTHVRWEFYSPSVRQIIPSSSSSAFSASSATLSSSPPQLALQWLVLSRQGSPRCGMDCSCTLQHTTQHNSINLFYHQHHQHLHHLLALPPPAPPTSTTTTSTTYWHYHHQHHLLALPPPAIRGKLESWQRKIGQR